jgi:hypothetical protein
MAHKLAIQYTQFLAKLFQFIQFLSKATVKTIPLGSTQTHE